MYSSAATTKLLGEVGSLSRDGSLLNISCGTVGGALSVRSSIIGCGRFWRCLSTSSRVIWPLSCGGCWTIVWIGFCTGSGLFWPRTFFFLPRVDPVLCVVPDVPASLIFFRLISFSSSEDSVSSVSLPVPSGFSYCKRRSRRNVLSFVTLSSFRWLVCKDSWKNSFSWNGMIATKEGKYLGTQTYIDQELQFFL